MFRKEAIHAKQNRLPGKVSLTQPVSIIGSCSLIFFLSIIAFIFLLKTEISRKETIKGYLVTEQGVVKVYSGRAGILEELSVVNGDFVKEGQILATIRNSQNLTTGAELSSALKKELTVQLNSLSEELKLSRIVFDKEQNSIDRNLRVLKKSLVAVKNSTITSNKRLNLKKIQYENNLELYKKGFLSRNALATIEEEVLDAQESLDTLLRDTSKIFVEISELESEKSALPEKFMIKRVEIQRNLSSLQAEIIQIDNQYEFTKSAPESGIVTAIQPTIGSQITADSPILSIIPKNSPLVLELLLPSRSAGFIQNGDEVKIRFDAFPYQKFGLINGRIIDIDKALLLPGERKIPIDITEAMYLVRASIEQQDILAYGKSFPLKVGMMAEADIILDKRSILEWLLDPIYAIKGKI